MGTALIKIKLMPTSPDTDLEAIKTNAEEAIKATGGKNPNFEEEPVAFGLKAVIAGFALDESKGLDETEEKLRAIENVSSVQVIDMRRALG